VTTVVLSESPDRIRAICDQSINARIDHDIVVRLQAYSQRPRTDIESRIRDLEREIPVERVLESRAALLAFTGATLGTTPGKDLIFRLRRMGVRTRAEIEREANAMRFLRDQRTQ
jgi:hypothetical protein